MFGMGIGIWVGIEIAVGIAVEDLETDTGDDAVASDVVHMMVAPMSKHWLLDVVILGVVVKVPGLVVDVDFARCFLAVVHFLQEDECFVLRFVL